MLQFFTGESINPDGAVGLLDFREDGVTPYMTFFKDGLEIEKCVSLLFVTLQIEAIKSCEQEQLGLNVK